MRKLLYLLTCVAFSFISFFISAQTTVKVSAIKANDYGVTYALPKTTFTLTVTVKKTTRKAGEYYQYADRFLGISNPIMQDETTYELTNVSLTNKGIPDKSNSFLVTFKSNTTSPYVTLTKDGLICAINTDSVNYEPTEIPTPGTVVSDKSILPNPRSFLSEETLSAGSDAKQAELIAKQILSLRATKNDILTGNADNRPPDGAAYKLVLDQINIQEKSLTTLFAGNEETENLTKNFTFTPSNQNIDNKILFRFSKHLGIVDPDDLAGAPVYLSLTRNDSIQKQELTPKEQKALDEKFAKGIIYNVPGKASIQVVFGSKKMLGKEVDVVQFGSQDVLTEKMFDNYKKPIKVIFYPELGAIKQIIQ